MQNKNNELSIKEINNIEKTILSSFLFYYSEISSIINISDIQVDFFFNPVAREIFKTIVYQLEKKENLDILSVHNTIKSKANTDILLSKFEKYFDSLSSEIQYYNINDHIKLLKNHYIKSHLDNFASKILKSNINYEDFSSILNFWKDEFLKIVNKDLLFGDEFLTSQDVMNSYEKGITNLSKDFFLKTHYDHLDNKIHGLLPNNLIILASRPGVGKTTFSLNLINNNLTMIQNNNKLEMQNAIAFFSLEMTNESMIEKLLCINSDSTPTQVKNFYLNKTPLNQCEYDKYKEIESSKKLIENSNILFSKVNTINIYQIISLIKSWIKKYKINLVIIDYLQLIDIYSTKENITEQQNIAIISRQLKLLSLEINVCIIALSQLNRKIEERLGSDQTPMLSDLRASGAIEQDADIVMFLYNHVNNTFKEENNLSKKQEIINLKIGKNRHGITDEIVFSFIKITGKFKKNNN